MVLCLQNLLFEQVPHYVDEVTIKKAIEFYRERFKERGMYENKLYPNVPDLLKSLREEDHQGNNHYNVLGMYQFSKDEILTITHK